MKPWVTLDSVTGPDGSVLTLQQRDDEFAIRVGGHVLMSSRMHGSEAAMAEVIAPGSAPTVLVGGLGMGYTLRAVLDRVGPGAKVIVAELIPQIVTWNRGPLAPLTGSALSDARVRVEEGDVRALVKTRQGTLDAILLDVDNGPVALTQVDNRHLYSDAGLGAIHQALSKRGVLVTWSAGEDPNFVRRLEKSGFEVEVRKVGAHSGRGQRHVLFVARRAAPRSQRPSQRSR